WRETAEPARTLVFGGGSVRRLVAVGLLHYCDRCFHAASRWLFHRGGRQPATRELLGFCAESLGALAIRAQHEWRGHYRRIRDDCRWSFLFALRQVDR